MDMFIDKDTVILKDWGMANGKTDTYAYIVDGCHSYH